MSQVKLVFESSDTSFVLIVSLTSLNFFCFASCKWKFLLTISFPKASLKVYTASMYTQTHSNSKLKLTVHSKKNTLPQESQYVGQLRQIELTHKIGEMESIDVGFQSHFPSNLCTINHNSLSREFWLILSDGNGDPNMRSMRNQISSPLTMEFIATHSCTGKNCRPVNNNTGYVWEF